MPKYEPPPTNLDALNPIQRYMQKGSLEREDWIRLGLIILAYFIARPYISKLFEWFFKSKDLSEGEAVQKEYAEKKAKAKIEPNAIRGGKGVSLEMTGPSSADATTSGSSVAKASGVVNRKSKVSSANDERSEEDKLLDWDDEPERPITEGVTEDKADVVAWLDRWSKEES